MILYICHFCHDNILYHFHYFRHHIIKPKSTIKYGKSYIDLPCRAVVQMTTDALAADTGPEGGIQCLSVKKKGEFDYFHGTRPVVTDCIAGIPNWNMHHFRAYGLSQSLYDFDPENQTLSGEPNADAFAVVARENNAFLAVADGVNWGEKPFMAARSAVKGCIEYLSDHIHKACNTQEIAKVMLCSFKHAQSCIIDNEATLTTLCAAVVCKLQDIDCYGLCVVNVGDSLAYVYRKEGLYVEEVTYGSHENKTRDMRTTGGCLGPSDGYNPDLTNLTCSFTFVEEGDIVFLTTDGISDNFDPVVLKKSTDEVKKLVNPVNNCTKSEENLLTDGHVGITAVERIKKLEFKRPRSYSEPPDSKQKSEPINSDILTIDEHRNYACELMKKVRISILFVVAVDPDIKSTAHQDGYCWIAKADLLLYL